MCWPTKSINRVLVLAPSRDTRGGITSVVKAHQNEKFWSRWKCVWIETYKDKGNIIKIYYFIKSLIVYTLYLPFCTIVHIHLSEPTSACRKSIYFYLASLFKKKRILHFHAFSVESTLHGPKRKLYINLFNKANAIIVLSTYWANHVRQIVHNPNATIFVVHNPILPNKIKNSNYKKKPLILYAGTLNERKGFKDLIKAFHNIARNNPNWKLVFAGNGQIEEGKQLANDLKIVDRVEFKGWVSGEEKKRLFNEASIFCLPSYAEGFPMAVLDAWGCDLPVVTTPVGGLCDVLQNGVNALVFEPGDVQTLSNHLELLMKNPYIRKQLSLESQKLSSTIFNIKSITKQLDNIYSSLYKN